MRIKFANWQPDLQGLTNPGQADIKNVTPTGGGGYGPVLSLGEISTTGLAGQCLGAFSAQDASDVTSIFAGDVSKLYQLAAGVFSDVSLSGGYSVPATEKWEFAEFGTRVLATEIGDNPQYFDIGSSSKFADLPGSPPKAKHVTVIRDFVVLGNTGNSTNEVYWSEFNNSGAWTKGTNQCDSQTLPDNGAIQFIVGGEVGYIFQERAITRMTYVGPPLIFQFDLLERARGLAVPGAIATIGTTSFYLAQDGFFAFDPYKYGVTQDAVSIVQGSSSIGNSKFDNWFSSHMQPGTAWLISAAIDPKNKLAIFGFVSTDATDASHPDSLLFYNWLSAEASYAKVSHEIVFPALTAGLTLEQLSAIYPNLDTGVPASLDSGQWTGGQSYLGAFDTSHQLCGFSGSTLAALLETADQEPIQGKRSLVTSIRPLCDTANAMALIRSRERFADTMANTNSSSMQSNGDIPVLTSGRFHRVQISIPAGEPWTYATAIDIDAQDDGEM